MILRPSWRASAYRMFVPNDIPNFETFLQKVISFYFKNTILLYYFICEVAPPRTPIFLLRLDETIR